MAIADVHLTDTFDQWRQKTNVMIDTVNSMSASADVVSVNSPVAAQILLYDGTLFRNVSISGDVMIALDGTVTVVGGSSGTSRGRIAFAGAIRSLY